MTDSTLDVIRGKSEESDLNTILKPTVVAGGYTKRSVIDYLSYLKKQQQDAKEAYEEEINSLRGEKERLQKENTELDTDLDEAMRRITADEERLESCEKELAALHTKANESEKSAAELRGLYDDASAKNEELNQIIADMSSEPEKQIVMQSCSVEMLSDEELEAAGKRLEELISAVETFKEELTKQADELILKTQSLGELTCGQLKKSRDAMEQMQIDLQARADQKELLESEKNVLSARVEELLEQNFTLSKENTRLKAANAILQRRMETK